MARSTKKNSKKNRIKLNAKRGREKLNFETLDERQVMAAYIDSVGDLVVQGTNANDTVQVNDFGSYVLVTENEGSPQVFHRSHVRTGQVKFYGRNGNDRFDARHTSLRTYAMGGSGNDSLLGGSSSDRLYGEAGRDYINGYDGNDRLYGGNDNDTVDGGNGNDYVYGDYGNDLVIGAAGNDTVIGGPGNDNLFGNDGNDRVEGHAGDDRIDGGNGNDWLFGTQGNDTILGGRGDDRLYGHQGDDALHGGTGNDYLYGDDGNDKLYGNAGVDRLFGALGNDQLFGNADNDFLYGGGGNDLLNGSSGNDYLAGESGHDRLIGSSGYDSLHGGTGDDSLFGGLRESDRSNTMVGGAGRDRLLYHGYNPPFENKNTEDVGIKFDNDDSNWTEKEIEIMDQAFADLQGRVGGHTWILKDSFSDNALLFIKSGSHNSWSGQNRYWHSIFNGYHRRIFMADWNESNAGANDWAKRVAIHEIGHNWDATHGEPNPYWSAFQSLSDRSRNDNDFARAYGRTNALEDWATIWEVAVGGAAGPARPSALFNQKLTLVNQFLSLHPSWRPGWNLPSIAEG